MGLSLNSAICQWITSYISDGAIELELVPEKEVKRISWYQIA